MMGSGSRLCWMYGDSLVVLCVCFGRIVLRCVVYLVMSSGECGVGCGLVVVDW